MNKEKYNQIIDEVYENYWNSIETSQYDGFGPTSIKLPTLTKEELINKIKTDDEFAKKWGLKIEERELSLEERNDIYKKQWEPGASELIHDRFDALNIPTKLITLTYNNKTIESYE